ncbi:hypothetical protein Ahy_B10g104926 [Arachis hypogaea]|uniref:Ubiquitin-like protease family profile domain-containing protein n=1 Tax=Arachis hypogaea TaxID=3818 RepID=A0A444X6U5_ARAHY|nr:hypothetical protein Ahy_B10g104926 [Arachis hypogaea]
MLQNMAIGNHNGGEFLHVKSKKPFDIEDYKMFIPFLDLKKLASHPYIFAPVCYGEHWWIWMADVRKKKFCILDPYHKKCPSPDRLKLNKFVVRVCDFQNEVYVIKWLEIIEPLNIKKGKYNWENWTQAEVDHFRVEYALQIPFHEMNQDRDTTIKPSTVLLSPYCQIDSDDIDSD